MLRLLALVVELYARELRDCAEQGQAVQAACRANASEHLLLQKKVHVVSRSRTQRCGEQFRTFGRHGAESMTECQGDCDSDSDCAPGLRCFQRRWKEPVPGCMGESYPVMDYCYNPACEGGGGVPLDSSYGSHGAEHMPKCSGDCDSDSDCAEGLSCFQRDGTQPVPGCTGTGVADFDYCYDPAESSTSTPAATTSSTSMPSSTESSACLCVFDIDRTLTGKQGTAGGECPDNLEVDGIWDFAYSPGWLTISDAGQNLEDTFCHVCYLGIVSAGWASGSDEKSYLLDKVLSKSVPFAELRARDSRAGQWSRRRTLGSPLVLGWQDTKKQDAVQGILQWYADRGIQIHASQVTFFGDRTENIGPFASKGYNAREISCGSRDMSIHNGMVGKCGGKASEIVATSGVKLCSDAEAPAARCLCVFDIDRTLTGKQGIFGHHSSCPANRGIQGVWDAAYSGGWLTLSEAGQHLARTFCNDCYLGVVSAGSASGDGSAERTYLLEHVLESKAFTELKDKLAKEGDALQWSTREVKSPLVLSWPDRLKQDAVMGIVEWYKAKGIPIEAANVHFFGDRTENIGPFRDTGFNSHEISCAKRDYHIGNGMVGLCGATLDEIRPIAGVAECA